MLTTSISMTRHLASRQNLLGGVDQTRTQTLTLPCRIDGQHAEVTRVATDIDVDAAGHRAAAVFKKQKRALLHARAHVVFVGAVPDCEEVLDPIGKRDEGSDGAGVAWSGGTYSHAYRKRAWRRAYREPPSVNVWLRSMASPLQDSSRPFGHRTITRSTARACPRPKCSRISFWE